MHFVREHHPKVERVAIVSDSKIAEKLDLKKDGAAAVEFKPLELPPGDGSLKPNAQ
jgi:hypothetical protein